MANIIDLIDVIRRTFPEYVGIISEEQKEANGNEVDSEIAAHFFDDKTKK